MGQNDDMIGGPDDDDGNDVPVSDCVLSKVSGIVADVLHVPRAEIGIATHAADVEGWDSFGHVRIVLAIETAFGIKLSMGEIEKADSIGGLVDAVEAAGVTH